MKNTAPAAQTESAAIARAKYAAAVTAGITSYLSAKAPTTRIRPRSDEALFDETSLRLKVKRPTRCLVSRFHCSDTDLTA